MRRRLPAKRPGLAIPTAKAGVWLALATSLAALVGTALGLPLPLAERESRTSSLSASAALVPGGAGIVPALTKGPFHPVFGEVDYGGGDARFGAPRYGRRHEGQDIFAKPGTALVAVRDGIVIDNARATGRRAGGRGNYLVVYSPLDDRSYVYFHLLKPPPVARGDRVRAGELVGRMGCTGSCYGNHLHFEVRIGRASFGSKTKPIDPLPLLRRWHQAPA
jgi:murein DD-endopeptidase MepM/ murein hydrolase activator NlpD